MLSDCTPICGMPILPWCGNVLVTCAAPMKTPSLIEPLEARIAPAILLSPSKVRFIDVDGDIVTVKFSKGIVDLGEHFTFVRSGRGEQLQRISLGGDASQFSDADLTISVARSGGNGGVHIGRIDAAGVDLGTVRVSGDLGRIDAGDADFTTVGVDFLKVRSMGRFGLATQAAGDASLASHVAGGLGTLKVAGAIRDASLSAMSGSIGSVIILGSLRGGEGDDSGMIHSTGGIGSIQIDGSIVGGAGQNSGAIVTEGSLGTLIVGGSIQSGNGAESGSVRVGGKIESIVVRGSLVGNEAHPVVLSAGGVPPTNAGDDAVGLGRARVVGNVAYAKLMAGYSPSGSSINGDAQIGKILVDGNWVASTAVAGSSAGPDGLFGTADDSIRFPHLNSVIARIAMIKIGGHAGGTKDSTADHFGFVAEEIGEVTIGARKSKLSPGPSNDDDPAAPQLAIGANGDFRIVEVSSLAPSPSLVTAVSRKIHGGAGAFDVDLPLTGTTGIESRTGDTLTLVFTFDHALSSGDAAIESGTGTVAGSPVFDGNQMIVTIGGVTDVQTLVVNLSSVTDTIGGVLETVSIPIAILHADVNGTRIVNIQDVNTVRAATVPGTIDATNFRTDVDLSGLVDAGDVSATRASSGNHLD